jgi:PBP1b-binding outer membrane lipoprotein LpoB
MFYTARTLPTTEVKGVTDMSWHKLIAPAVLASAVVLTGCSDDSASDEKTNGAAPASQQGSTAMDELKKEAGETMDAAGKVAAEAGEEVRSTTSEMVDKAAEVSGQAEEKAKETYEQVKSEAEEMGEKAAETTEEMTEAARQKMEEMQQEEAPDSDAKMDSSESN